VIAPTEPDLAIDADRQILASVVSNLLQNAFKYSHPHSNIVLHAHGADGMVLIDVEDECGGLPAGEPEGLFQPYERRSSNRTGLGLGLTISREGAKANGGTLVVRDVPGHGCVFTVQLPRHSSSGA
jgi:signal transduction histidine kinase